MCDFGISAIAMMAISAAMTAASQIGQAQQQSAQMRAQSDQAAYQAKVASNNQTIAKWQADDAVKRAGVEEDRVRARGAQIMGSQIAGFAAQGTTVTGSATDILGDTAASTELDALTTRSNGEREAYSHTVQGMNDEANAGLLNSKAAMYSSAASANDSSAPFLVAGTLVGAAANISGKWYSYNNPGGRKVA